MPSNGQQLGIRDLYVRIHRCSTWGLHTPQGCESIVYKYKLHSSHTAKLIAQAGMRPVVLDSLQEGQRWAVQYGPFVQGDINDADLVRTVLKKESIEAVIHFAAYAYVGESIENPRKYFENNLVGTMSLLHAMLDVDVKTIIFSSTCATYGIPKKLPITEDTPHRNTPYTTCAI